MLLVGPDVPASLRPLMLEVVDALKGLSRPGAPTALHACSAAELPPAPDWRHGLVLVTDLNILAHSDGVSWIRQDTGGAI